VTHLEWALKYAERGLTIFPVWWIEGATCACGMSGCSEGKHPIIGGGFKHASGNPDVINAWFKKWPKANIGCLPGASGYVVLDLDGPIGMESARALGLLAEPTLETQSGRVDGGRHRWYRHPGGTIGNKRLAPGIDVRADGGYVILPPSNHISGNRYRWLGRFDEIIALPEHLVATLTSAAPVPVASVAGQADAMPIAGPSIRDELLTGMAEGGRNTALARYAGRLFAKGLTIDEVQITLLGVNQTVCSPPLGVNEVLMIARSIGAAEARSGIVRTPHAGSQSPAAAIAPATPAPTMRETSEGALAGAQAILSRDPSIGIQWVWPSVRKMMGAMLPGEIHTLGALSGNGKTSLVMTQIEHHRKSRVPTLLVPLEIDPAIALVREACWVLGLDVKLVMRGEWWLLPEGAKGMIADMVEELSQDNTITYVPDKVVDAAGLLRWMERAKGETGARCVVIDHIHRMSTGGKASDARVSLNGMVQRIADGCRDLGMVGIVTAQLNRKETDGFDRYKPPNIERIKESAAIGEEASTVAMASRALIHTISKEDFENVRLGKLDTRELAAPNVLVWTCRKHRLDDDALDRSVRLDVRNGRVQEPTPIAHMGAPSWQHN
jgi:hypothetical protein